jgi:hypothetical protein
MATSARAKACRASGDGISGVVRAPLTAAGFFILGSSGAVVTRHVTRDVTREENVQDFFFLALRNGSFLPKRASSQMQVCAFKYVLVREVRDLAATWSFTGGREASVSEAWRRDW